MYTCRLVTYSFHCIGSFCFVAGTFNATSVQKSNAADLISREGNRGVISCKALWDNIAGVHMFWFTKSTLFCVYVIRFCVKLSRGCLFVML